MLDTLVGRGADSPFLPNSRTRSGQIDSKRKENLEIYLPKPSDQSPEDGGCDSHKSTLSRLQLCEYRLLYEHEICVPREICLPSFARIRAICGNKRARDCKRQTPQRIQPGVFFLPANDANGRESADRQDRDDCQYASHAPTPSVSTPFRFSRFCLTSRTNVRYHAFTFVRGEQNDEEEAIGGVELC